MRRFRAQPLRRQLFIVILALLLPLIATAWWAGAMAYRERVDDIREQAVVTASMTAAYMNRYIGSLDLLATSLRLHPAVQSLDANAAAELFRRAFAEGPLVSNVVLVTSDQREIAGAARTEGGTPGEHDWAAAVFESRRRAVSPLHVDPATGVSYVMIGYPVPGPDGTPVAALGLQVRFDTVQRVFASLPMAEGSVVTVTDDQGLILARTMAAERFVGTKTPQSPRPLTQLPEYEELVGVDGVRRLYGNAVAGNGPWVISVGIPLQVAYMRANALWNRSVTILFLGLVGWVMVAMVISRQLVRALDHLRGAAQRIAGGDLRPLDRKTMPARELSELQEAFGTMVQRLDEARKALDDQMAEERQMREELQLLQRQVIRQERLAAVGLLVSGVAHEINNPLQAIMGFAELLPMQHKLPEDVRKDLRLIQKESGRACNIIRNLALFARQQPEQAQPVRIADVVTSVAELRQRRLESEDIELMMENSSSQHVLAVFSELQQVVLNFVVNAEQAIVNSGRLPGRITIHCRDEDSRVVLEVEDTGPGVPPENEAKLFQPFFTTKPVGQGTGLGLSVSYGIIDSLGGHIGYRRAAAGGAVFYFELPVVAATGV